MRKALKILVGLILAVVAIVLIALPRVAPPIVENLVSKKLASFGVDTDVRLKLGYCWRNGPGIEGSLRVSVPDAPWRVSASFGASCCEWSAKVSMPETSFSESDALVRSLLMRFPPKGVTNLVFSGAVALNAKAERTFRMPVAVWSAKVPIRNVCATLSANGQDIAIDSFSVIAGASGIAKHVDVSPMFPHAKSVTFGNFTFTNFYASVRATEKSLMANEIGAGFWGGQVNVYSLFLNPATLSTGFTLLLDDINAETALRQFKGFSGEASGRLHGKLKAFVKEGGRAVHLRDLSLYSALGEVGKLRMRNPEAVTENLAYAGLDATTRANVADALTDLDYSVLRMNLHPGADGKSTQLSVQIRGTATRKKTTVPVDITVNINGELQQLVNSGLEYSAKLKGKNK